MNKLGRILLFAVLLGGIAAQATGYQPLVREGRTWVNVFRHTNYWNDYKDSLTYYLEFKGDTIIGTKTFAKCYRTTASGGDVVVNDGMVDFFFSSSSTPCAYFREEGGKVYIIMHSQLDETNNPTEQELERVVYDFDSLMASGEASYVNIAGSNCRQIQIESGRYVESIGYVADYSGYFGSGDLVTPRLGISTDMIYSSCQLRYVMDSEKQVIYMNPYISWKPCDLNLDDHIDITDVNIAVYQMLNEAVNELHPFSCDVTGDGSVDIADVNAIINAMLTK